MKKLIIGIAVFAAGISQSANAQTYEERATFFTRADDTFQFGNSTIDLSKKVSDIISDVIAESQTGTSLADFQFYRNNDDDPGPFTPFSGVHPDAITIAFNEGLNASGIPFWSTMPREVLSAGNHIFIRESSNDESAVSSNFYIYSEANGDLYIVPAYADRKRQDELAPNEFYLRSNGMRTSVITPDTLGYITVQTSFPSIQPIPISPSSSSSSDGVGLAVGGSLLLMLLIFSWGNTFDFAFSPDFGYSVNESGYAVNAGGRWDFRKDNWHLYFSGDSRLRGNGNTEFRYNSGGKYTAGFWTAAFSESVVGKTADYNFALSANMQNGIWKLSPIYRMHSRFSDNEFTTRNSLNLESEFRYDSWTIRPSAGFNWRTFGEFASNGTFRIHAVHRF